MSDDRQTNDRAAKDREYAQRFQELRTQLARAKEQITAQADLIRALEHGHTLDAQRIAQLQSIIARATDHAAKQLQYYRTDANASGDGTATYHAALCHHYTLMLECLTEEGS